MANKKQNMTFEDCLSALENSISRLNSSDLPLEEAIKEYEAGTNYAKRAEELLNEAKGKLVIYSKETDQTEDFQ